jgi:hypothetical protein
VDGKGFRPKRKKLFLSFTKLKRYFRCMATDNSQDGCLLFTDAMCCTQGDVCVCRGVINVTLSL